VAEQVCKTYFSEQPQFTESLLRPGSAMQRCFAKLSGFKEYQKSKGEETTGNSGKSICRKHLSFLVMEINTLQILILIIYMYIWSWIPKIHK